MSSEYLYRELGQVLFIYCGNHVSKVFMHVVQSSFVVQESILYIIGGKNANHLSPDIYLVQLNKIDCDVSLNECSEIVGQMVFLRTCHSSCMHKSKIYTLGGADNNAQSDVVEMFDTETLESTLVCSMPFALKLHSTCVSGDKIFVGGGYKVHGKFNENVFFFDIELKKWEIKETKNSSSAIRPTLIPLSEKLLICFGGWVKDCKFNNKVNVINMQTLERKILKGFSFRFAEVFKSWKVQRNLLTLVDHCGLMHQVNIENLKKAAEFEMTKKKVWKRKKVFLFFLKFAEMSKPALPAHLIREISAYL